MVGTQKKCTHSFSEVLDINGISCPPEEFPSVSMARLRSDDPKERERELDRLAAGAREWGMLVVYDHGIPFSLQGDVREVVNGFFKLPLHEKKESVGTYVNEDNMGYGSNFLMTEGRLRDWADRLIMVAAPPGSTVGLNVWPQKPSNFRKVIEEYTKESRKLGDELLGALAESLSLDPNAFVKYFDPKTSEIKAKINNYAPCPNPNSELGLCAHTDSSALTLVTQFHSSGGLQVMHKDGKNWVNVPWPVDSLLIVVGDFLEIMSNGRVKSREHRVVAKADAERSTIALFYNPSSSMEIEPAKSHDWEGTYKKVVVGDYVRNYYNVCPPVKPAYMAFALI